MKVEASIECAQDDCRVRSDGELKSRVAWHKREPANSEGRALRSGATDDDGSLNDDNALTGRVPLARTFERRRESPENLSRARCRSDSQGRKLDRTVRLRWTHPFKLTKWKLECSGSGSRLWHLRIQRRHSAQKDCHQGDATHSKPPGRVLKAADWGA